MKRKIFTVLITLALVIGLVLSCCWYLKHMFDNPEIKGFSPKLADELNGYGITIPDGAVFIKGYRGVLQDKNTLILFEYPLSSQIKESDLGDYVFDLLKLDEEMWPRGAVEDSCYVGEGYDGIGDSTLDWMLKHQSKPFTVIEFSQKDGKLLIRLNVG